MKKHFQGWLNAHLASAFILCPIWGGYVAAECCGKLPIGHFYFLRQVYVTLSLLHPAGCCFRQNYNRSSYIQIKNRLYTTFKHPQRQNLNIFMWALFCSPLLTSPSIFMICTPNIKNVQAVAIFFGLWYTFYKYIIGVLHIYFQHHVL